METQHEGQERDSTKTKVLIFLLILALLSLAYMPALQGYFVHHDDWYFWSMKEKWVPRYHPVSRFLRTQCGRPVAPVLMVALGSIIDELKDANLARFITVTQLSLLAFLVYWWLRKHGFERLHALLLVIAAYTLPAFQSGVGTISNSHHVTACLFAFGATILAWQGAVELERQSGKHPRSHLIKACLYAIVAIALIILTLATYQAAAMFYWFLIAITLFAVDVASPGRWIRRYGYLFGTAFLAMLIYFCYLQSLPARTDVTYTPEIATDYSAKLRWFIKEPLINALNLWKLWPSRALAFLTGGVILAGWTVSLFLAFWKATKKIKPGKAALRCGLKYGLILVLVPLCILPNLVAKHHVGAYRTLTVFSVYLLLLLVWSLGTLIRVLPGEKFRRSALTVLLLFGCGLGIWTSHYNMMNYYNFPQTLELRYIKSAIRQAGPEGYDKIVIIKPAPFPNYSFVAPAGRYDEFATPATGFAQDISQIVTCAIRELNLEHAGQGPYKERTPVICEKSEYKGHDSRTLLIDMTRLGGFY